MGEFEIFEALMMSMELSVLASMNFLAIAAAYLIAAYVAGKKLPRVVAVGTSLIYTMFLVPPFNGMIGNLRRVHALGSHLETEFPDSLLITSGTVPFEATVLLFGLPMIVGWLGSIYFMHAYIRGVNKNA
jgi:hypothetical protein